MRKPTATEISIIQWFAARLDEDLRQSVLSDLNNAMAEEIRDEHLTIHFEIDGYTRPPYRFERPLPVDAAVVDADGAKLSVALVVDENGRIFELQITRYEDGPVLNPNWSTLRLLRPGELIRLNEPSEPLIIKTPKNRR